MKFTDLAIAVALSMLAQNANAKDDARETIIRTTVRSCPSYSMSNPSPEEQSYIFNAALESAKESCGDPAITSYQILRVIAEWGDSSCPVYRITELRAEFKCTIPERKQPIKDCSYGKCGSHDGN